MGFYAPDVVWDGSNVGIGTFDGASAVRSLLDDLFGAFEVLHFDVGEIGVVGDGVVLAVVASEVQPHGSDSSMESRDAVVYRLVDGLTVWLAHYRDIDVARATALRLAGSQR